MQPYVALGAGLAKAGEEVSLVGPAVFETLVSRGDLGFLPTSMDPIEGVRQQLDDGDVNLLQFAARSRRFLVPLLEELIQDCLEACQDADVIIYSSVGILGQKVGQVLGKPTVGAMYGPLLNATRYFPSSFLPTLCGKLRLAAEGEGVGEGLQRTYNRITYSLVQQTLWQYLRTPVNKALLNTRGLSPYSFSGPFQEICKHQEPVLNGWSRHVLPHPPDWGEHLPVTGYWFLDHAEDWEPPRGLQDFLGSGAAPVSIGFGSMSGSQTEELIEVVVRALELAGQRGVILSGWGGIGNYDLPDTIYQAEEVPHDWLLPRVAASVHHGGAGTTAASLRAGVPTLVVPFFADQFFWGARVAGLSAGPRPIPRGKVSADRLALAIRQMINDRQMRNRASSLGEDIRNEDGVNSAVEAFYSVVG